MIPKAFSLRPHHCHCKELPNELPQLNFLIIIWRAQENMRPPMDLILGNLYQESHDKRFLGR